jgi:integrase
VQGGLAVRLLQDGERRGRGQAVGADVDGLRAVAQACPNTLTGDRDKALVLTGFHYASRSQDPACLLVGDVTLHPRGLVIAVLTGKTKHSVRNAKIRYGDDPEICPVRAWTAYRARLVAEQGQRWADPSTPAFVGIDRWGHVTGGMGPDSVTRAIKRISTRAGVPLAWTGHSLRIGLASTARRAAWDALQDYLGGRTEGWLFQTATGGRLDEPAVWRLLQSLAKRAGLPLRGPHGTKSDAITHALAKKDARPDKVQRWADHKDSRTTQRYNRRKELLDDSPGYGLAADLASALEHGTA